MAGARSAVVQRSLEDLDRVVGLATEADRHDLAGLLRRARARWAADDSAVAVVGEFKQGKSTLINALLRTEVCPVDTDIVTAVPTIVRFGVPPAVTARLQSGTGPMSVVDVGFGRLREYVSEQPAHDTALQTVDVRLDRQLLRSGLTLIDTPGVGGLDSAQGNITLGALPTAQAALFVTDAAQELTAPELDFLRRTVERCPTVVCVVTKIDLHDQWRRIVEINSGHLSTAGLSLPIVAVSSFLRLRAAAGPRAPDSAALNAESGFPRLLDLLRRRVLDDSDATAVRAVGAEISFVLTQLREQIGAERLVVRSPAAGEALIGTLTEKARRSHQLVDGAATWQTTLSDGLADLGNQIRDDLETRLNAMLRRGEALIDEGDPIDNGPELEAWAAREAVAVAIDNLFLVVSRSERLAREVAERFELEYDNLDLDLPAPTALSGDVAPLDLRFQRSAMREFLVGAMASRAVLGGALILGSFVPISCVAPIGAALGWAVGRKLLRDERGRQVELRRQQTKQTLRRYVNEVGAAAGRTSRDAVTQARRYFRDEFATRASLAERSATLALAAVRQAADAPEHLRARRAPRLDAQWRDLELAAGRANNTLLAAVPAGQR